MVPTFAYLANQQLCKYESKGANWMFVEDTITNRVDQTIFEYIALVNNA